MFPAILNKCFVQDSCVSGFYYAVAKDIRLDLWCIEILKLILIHVNKKSTRNHPTNWSDLHKSTNNINRNIALFFIAVFINTVLIRHRKN